MLIFWCWEFQIPASELFSSLECAPCQPIQELILELGLRNLAGCKGLLNPDTRNSSGTYCCLYRSISAMEPLLAYLFVYHNFAFGCLIPTRILFYRSLVFFHPIPIQSFENGAHNEIRARLWVVHHLSCHHSPWEVVQDLSARMAHIYLARRGGMSGILSHGILLWT